MNNELIGYIVIIRMEGWEGYETVAYGEEGQPAPDELLRDRGAAFFESKALAWAAIDETKAVNDEWVSKTDFGVQPVFKKIKAAIK